MKARYFWKNTLLTLGILAAAGAICAFLQKLSGDSGYVSMIFILAVFLIARLTDGYVCGIIASVAAVLAVNFLFTYPYYQFNFTLAGYPLTIVCMLIVSLTTSALTTGTKNDEKLKLLAEKEKMRGNLLRAVSHDLRTPLTSILGAISAVLENDETLSPRERRTLLCGAQDDAQWLIRMVENLLTVTRLDAENGASIEKTLEMAEELVSGAAQKFKKRFPDFTVTARVPDEVLLIPMDAVLIEQVLINLLENAALHGVTADRADITVEKKAGEAVFRVRDNGVGIDSSKLAHIFDGSTTQQGDDKRNMGIGLSVCEAIIKAHGGRMAARNQPGGGAELEFRLGLSEENHGD